MHTSSIKPDAVLFCRVSSREQEETGYSLEAQEKSLKNYAQDKFNLVKIYKISESASGKQVRKIFNEMLSYVKRKRINIIICEKIDRLTRNLKDASTISDWIAKDPKREVHFVKESFVVNQNTRAHENLVWDMKVAIARFYTNNLSEEVKKGHREKIEQGHLPLKPRFGYKTKEENGHKIHVINEEVAPYLCNMFEWYATSNYSLERLERDLYKAGLRSQSGKKLATSMIHRYLSDPYYYGAIKWKGKLYPGKHEPLISKDLFDKVQNILTGRGGKGIPLTKHNPLFKSKIQCSHCKGAVTWEKQKGHWYGHCNNHGKSRGCPGKTYLRQEKIEEVLYFYFERIAPKNEEVLRWIEEMITEEYGKEVAVREDAIRKITKQLTSLRSKKDKYFEAIITKEVPADYCERKIAECVQEETALEKTLRNVSELSNDYLKIKIEIHKLAYKSMKIYKNGIPDEKRMLFAQIFTNLIQNRYEIKPNFTLAGEYLMNWVPRLNQIIEPPKRRFKQGKIEDLTLTSPPLQGWRDDLRTKKWREMFPDPIESLKQIQSLLAIA